MSRLSGLVLLQETDFALDKRRTELEDAESRLGETEELIELRARAEALRLTLNGALGSQKDVELEADALKAKIEPAEAKLYGGTIKNPKELADLQADIDQLKRHLSAVEDRDLAALAELESAQQARGAAESELTAMEEAWKAEQAKLRARIKILTTEIAGFATTRDSQSPDIEPALLKTYDHVRRVHQGRGVAKIDRNLCLGCRISLPVSAVNRTRAGTQIVQCPNCERILYA